MSRLMMAGLILVTSAAFEGLGVHMTIDWAGGMCAGLFLTWIAGYERTDKAK